MRYFHLQVLLLLTFGGDTNDYDYLDIAHVTKIDLKDGSHSRKDTHWKTDLMIQLVLERSLESLD